MTAGLTVAEQRYLKAAWYVSRDAAVTVGAVADRVGVSHASASTTIGRLADRGLLDRVDGREFALTPAGEERALRLVRRHRLMETFLAETLGLAWDEVHEEAERLEWWISDRVESLIADVLGDPARDPHGDPIPPADGAHEEVLGMALAELAPGVSARIVRVDDHDPELLRYLADQGLGLGSVVRVEGREPFGGPLRLTSEAGGHSLGELAVAAIWVSLLTGDGEVQSVAVREAT